MKDICMKSMAWTLRNFFLNPLHIVLSLCIPCICIINRSLDFPWSPFIFSSISVRLVLSCLWIPWGTHREFHFPALFWSLGRELVHLPPCSASSVRNLTFHLGNLDLLSALLSETVVPAHSSCTQTSFFGHFVMSLSI